MGEKDRSILGVKIMDKMVQEKSPLKAIRQQCLQCVGYDATEVKNCTSKNICQLYPFRFGKNPFNKRRMTEEQRAAVIERLQSARERKLQDEASKL